MFNIFVKHKTMSVIIALIVLAVIAYFAYGKYAKKQEKAKIDNSPKIGELTFSVVRNPVLWDSIDKSWDNMA